MEHPVPNEAEVILKKYILWLEGEAERLRSFIETQKRGAEESSALMWRVARERDEAREELSAALKRIEKLEEELWSLE